MPTTTPKSLPLTPTSIPTIAMTTDRRSVLEASTPSTETSHFSSATLTLLADYLWSDSRGRITSTVQGIYEGRRVTCFKGKRALLAMKSLVKPQKTAPLSTIETVTRDTSLSSDNETSKGSEEPMNATESSKGASPLSAFLSSIPFLSSQQPSIPGITVNNRADAEALLRELVVAGFIAPVQRHKSAPSPLKHDPTPILDVFTLIHQKDAQHSHDNGNCCSGGSSGVTTSKGASGAAARVIDEKDTLMENTYYMWIYEGSPLRQMLMAGAVLTVALAIGLFPLWPVTVRRGVWYLSVGVLGLLGCFMALTFVRLAIFAVTFVYFAVRRQLPSWKQQKQQPVGCWLFPQLFADVSVVESFTPVWEMEYMNVSCGDDSSQSTVPECAAAPSSDTTACDEQSKVTCSLSSSCHGEKVDDDDFVVLPSSP